MLTVEQALERLRGFGYTAEEYAGNVKVTEAKRVPLYELATEEIHAALNYEVDRRSIKQIDSWTIVVILE